VVTVRWARPSLTNRRNAAKCARHHSSVRAWATPETIGC
jgi:hypothetical protein